MRKFYIVLLATLFVVTTVGAQVAPMWQWAVADTAAIININPAYPQNVVAAHNGRVIWGASQNVQTNGTLASLGDYKLTLFDSTGTVMNTTDLLGELNLIDAHADDAGNWYLLGSFKDSVQFANGFTATNPNMFSGEQSFICKLFGDALSLLWYEPIGATDATTQAFYIKGSNIYFATGYFDSVVVSRMNTTTGTATVLFSQIGSRDVSSLVVDDAGNIYMAGSCDFNGTLNCNGQVITVPFTYQTFIVRYHSNGQFDWVQWMSDVTCTERQLNIADDNTLYYTGVVNDTMSLDGNTFHNPQFGSNFIAAQLDSDGHANWVHQMKDTIAGSAIMGKYSATIGAGHSLVIAPNTRGYIDWGNGVVANQPLSSYGGSIVNIAADGNIQWNESVIANYLGLQHVVSDGSDVFITGNTGFASSSTLQFGSIAMPVLQSGYSPYIAKLKTPPPSGIGTLPICTSADVYVVPNPATNSITLSNLNAVKGTISISMLDVAGRVVFSKELTNNTGKETINVSAYPRGLYFMQINGNAYRQITKIILE